MLFFLFSRMLLLYSIAKWSFYWNWCQFQFETDKMKWSHESAILLPFFALLTPDWTTKFWSSARPNLWNSREASVRGFHELDQCHLTGLDRVVLFAALFQPSKTKTRPKSISLKSSQSHPQNLKLTVSVTKGFIKRWSPVSQEEFTTFMADISASCQVENKGW